MSSVSDLIIRYNLIFTLQSAVFDDFISFLLFLCTTVLTVLELCL